MPLQTRQSGLEGTGKIALRDLVKESLRMRPSRIIVGEVRAEECLDLLLALNAGLPGMCTLHANGAREALAKMCTLPLLAGESTGSLSAFTAAMVPSRSADVGRPGVRSGRRRNAGGRQPRQVPMPLARTPSSCGDAASVERGGSRSPMCSGSGICGHRHAAALSVAAQAEVEHRGGDARTQRVQFFIRVRPKSNVIG